MTIPDYIDLLKVLLTVSAGAWIYFRFARERTHARRVEFSLDCAFYGPQNGRFLAEFVFEIKNRGLVVHRFDSLHLRVRGVRRNSELQPWQMQPSRVDFPERVIDEPDVIMAKKYSHIFVEPGVEQTITFVGAVPEEIGFILARAEFRYSDSRTHSTERLFQVGPSKTESLK
jgi:hypothetical protein